MEESAKASWWTSERRRQGLEQLQAAKNAAEENEGSRPKAWPKISELIEKDLDRADRLSRQLGVTGLTLEGQPPIEPE